MISTAQKSNRSTQMASTEHAEIDALAELDSLQWPDLQRQWQKLYGRKVPARLGPELVKRAIAYRLQEIACGGLNRASQLRLKASMTNGGKAGAKFAPTSSVIKPGTRFVREWKGETHEVLSSPDGSFAYRGKPYRSLSVIARDISGIHQSGPRFFGIKPKPAAAVRSETFNGR